jgi:hypothetical protein
VRITSFVLLILIFLISGCNVSNQMVEINEPMSYDFNEPVSFPFEVNEVHTVIDNIMSGYLQQFVFHYKNKQSTQEIRYILSKVMEKPQKLSDIGTPTLELENGKQAYYEDDGTSQSIWWEGENGFLARFVYYVNGNSVHLDDNNKLEISELINLANQVQ